jgi:hypothetical protein
VFCKVLFAQQAAINTLQAQLIQIGNAIFGGERFSKSNDGMGVVDKGSDLPGFSLDKNGLLQASRAIISGNFMADNFEAGPLLVSQTDPVNVTRNFLANETAKNIYDTVQTTGSYNVTGTYGSLSISAIEFSSFLYIPPDLSDINTTYEVYVKINNNRTLIAKSEIRSGPNAVNTHPSKLANALSFVITLPGKKMRLLNLPTSLSEVGVVYKQTNGDGTSFLKVKD